MGQVRMKSVMGKGEKNWTLIANASSSFRYVNRGGKKPNLRRLHLNMFPPEPKPPERPKCILPDAGLIPSRYQDWAAGYKSPERTDGPTNGRAENRGGGMAAARLFFET